MDLSAYGTYPRNGYYHEWDALRGGLSKGSEPVFTRVAEKTTENSERLGRQARPGINFAGFYEKKNQHEIFSLLSENCNFYFLFYHSPASGGAVLPSKLVCGKCRHRSTGALVDLAVRSFPWFSPQLA